MIGSTWAIPATLGLLTLASLVVALAGEGLPDMLAAVGLATPIAAIGWAFARRT